MAPEEPQEVQNWVRQRVLGSGGFGVVTLWKHKNKEEMIALKMCRSGTDHLLTPKHKERWAKEVDIMQRLSHPNVVRAIPVPSELATLRSELPVLCMEFCSKGDLRQVLNRSENCCGLQESDVRFLISDVKNAVQYLHTMKITHRDLKPENIVLQQNESRIVHKLIDLGYAKELDQSSICTSFVGTLQYLAPELFMSKAYTSSVDYWSLGLVSHEVITGVRPFLPNMAPVAWMNHIQKKSSDDICAYQAQDGNIVFCKEIFPQNHITSTLRYHIEEWLKVILEWDSKKRGRNRDMKVIVFDTIEEILNKKIIQLFSVATYQKLSYEIDDSTAVSTVKEWVKRDTGIAVDEQDLLLSDGSSVDPNREACQCWRPHSVRDGSPMVYVFQVKNMSIPQVTPSIPHSVGKMMEEPRSTMEYIHQKRAWAHAVFFLQQESDLYNIFRHSYRVKLLHLFSKCDSLKRKFQSMNTHVHQAQATLHLCLQSLQVDQEILRENKIVWHAVQQKWQQSHGALKTRMDEVNKKALEFQQICEAINKRMTALQSNPQLKLHEPNALQALSEAGLKCYEQLRRRPKEVRSQRSDSVEMVKVVYNCLKQRDILMRDKGYNIHLQHIGVLQEDIENLLDPVEKHIEEVKNLKDQIYHEQFERQRTIWKLVKDECNTFPRLTNSPINDLHGKEKYESPENQNAESVYYEVSNPHNSESFDICNNSKVTPPSTDTSAMIRDNLELRYMTQEAMNESFQRYRSIVSEGQSLNWSHLH